jgi:hypothetical protein
MANAWDDLKSILSGELSDTVGKLWNSDQDKAFLQYNAEKVAKYVTLYKDPASSAAAKSEAKFNLDMLQTSIAAYVVQKTIVAGQSTEETAKKVLAFLIGVLVKAA